MFVRNRNINITWEVQFVTLVKQQKGGFRLQIHVFLLTSSRTSIFLRKNEGIRVYVGLNLRYITHKLLRWTAKS